jgi:hypothetical protein
MFYLFVGESPIDGREIRNVRRVVDGVTETMDEDNPVYLAWLAEGGNTPEPWEAQ